MKKKLFIALLVAFSLCTSALAVGPIQRETTAEYTVFVNGQPLTLDDLPFAPYQEGNTVMVPLRKISEALGYKVGWDPESKAISVDDEYVQKAILFSGTATVIFEGRLQVIDMSRQIENSIETIVHDGYTYVPMEFFEEFFNDVTVDKSYTSRCASKQGSRSWAFLP